MSAIQLPPPAYRLAQQSVVVSFMSQDDVNRACKLFIPLRPGQFLLGCSRGMPAACIVTLPTPQSWRGTGDAYRELVEHELGHCAGWPGNHPKE